jgi:hypothetical protein
VARAANIGPINARIPQAPATSDSPQKSPKTVRWPRSNDAHDGGRNVSNSAAAPRIIQPPTVRPWGGRWRTRAPAKRRKCAWKKMKHVWRQRRVAPPRASPLADKFVDLDTREIGLVKKETAPIPVSQVVAPPPAAGPTRIANSVPRPVSRARCRVRPAVRGLQSHLTIRATWVRTVSRPCSGAVSGPLAIAKCFPWSVSFGHVCTCGRESESCGVPGPRD